MRLTAKAKNWLMACTGVGAIVAMTWGFTKCSADRDADARVDAIAAEKDSIQNALNHAKEINLRAVQELADIQADYDSLDERADSMVARIDSLESALVDCHNCRRTPARKKMSVKRSSAVAQATPAGKPSVKRDTAVTVTAVPAGGVVINNTNNVNVAAADTVKNNAGISVHGNNNVVITGNGNNIYLTHPRDSVRMRVRAKYQNTCVVTVTRGPVR